jgi:MFS transporter, ACS family, tartrate transporter
LALINSVASLSGFVVPYMIGMLNDLTGSLTGGLVVLACALLLAGLLVLTLRPEAACETVISRARQSSRR